MGKLNDVVVWVCKNKSSFELNVWEDFFGFFLVLFICLFGFVWFFVVFVAWLVFLGFLVRNGIYCSNGTTRFSPGFSRSLGNLEILIYIQ